MEPQAIFICSTYYHVLIAIALVLTKSISADIILMSYIPNYRNLSLKLTQNNIFGNVILFERNKINQYYTKSILKKIFFQRKKNTEIIEKKLKIDLKRYQTVYIFHDSIELGNYLQDIKCPYILLEDALDFFKIIDKTVFASEIPNTHSIIYWLKKILNKGHLPSGQSRYCKKIIVNDIKGIKIPTKKVIEQSKVELFSSLNIQHQKKICNVFFDVNNLEINNSSKKVLLLTQPLYDDKIVSSKEIQYQIYKNICDEYSAKGYIVYIKPHPRDTFPYNKNFIYNMIIDKNAPAEVLGYLNIEFDIAISISSTAIYSIQFAKSKIMLGNEYLKNNIESR